MKNYTHDIERLESIMNRYKLVQPKTVDYQKKLLGRKKPVLKKILRILGIYSMFTGALIAVYFLLKKSGITAFTAKIVMAVMTAATVTTSGYFAASYIIPKITADSTEQIITGTGLQEENATKSKDMVKPVRYTIGIRPLVSKSIDKTLLNSFNNRLIARLRSINGNHYSGIIIKDQPVIMKHEMFSSIESMGDTFILYVKVVDLKTSAIKLLIEKKSTSLAEAENEYMKISEQIAAEIK